MGANLYWKPVDESGTALDCDTPSSTIEVLTRAFGDMPVTITPDHIDIIRGFAFVDPRNLTWAQILAVLDRHGAIRIEARY